MENNYGRNQGVEILEKIVQQRGPIFTIEDAYEVGTQLSLAPIQVAKTLSKMSKSGWLTRLKRGLISFNPL
ncbi:MAG: type IV toxin-antitoxin system AbiEi family antitoxin domain-containing protein, partial [Anaerolineales bacterium]|nr:type IV toxin-antitoxin system AbiEi family antitoxin domain-containing protein [Anaerolineales bacterium]